MKDIGMSATRTDSDLPSSEILQISHLHLPAEVVILKGVSRMDQCPFIKSVSRDVETKLSLLSIYHPHGNNYK